MILRFLFLLSTLLFLSICVSLMLGGCTKDFSQYKNRPVVKVNTSELSATEFSELLVNRMKMFNSLSAKDSAIINQAKSAIIRDFIVKTITTDWARANQIFVRKELLTEETTRLRKQYPDDIAFRRALAKEGLSYDVWEERVNYGLLERLVLNELRKSIKMPTSNELQEYYQKNKTLYQTPAGTRLKQVVLNSELSAQRVKHELDRGKSLSELAKMYSTTPEGQQGGDIGWVEKGGLDIFDAAHKMRVGQRSGIVKSPFGYHIFEVTAKRPAKTSSFEEVKKKVEAAVFADREQEVYSSWLEDLVLKARVFKDDELIKQVHVHTRGSR